MKAYILHFNNLVNSNNKITFDKNNYQVIILSLRHVERGEHTYHLKPAEGSVSGEAKYRESIGKVSAWKTFKIIEFQEGKQKVFSLNYQILSCDIDDTSTSINLSDSLKCAMTGLTASSK